MASKRNWIELKEYVFVDPQINGFYWIFWKPGTQTEEGFEEYPQNINPRLPGYPSHYMRCSHELAKELKQSWLSDFLVT